MNNSDSNQNSQEPIVIEPSMLPFLELFVNNGDDAIHDLMKQEGAASTFFVPESHNNF